MYHTNYTRNIFKNKTQDVYLFTVDSREDSLARIRPVTPVIAVFCSVAGRLSVIHTRLKKASMSSLEEHQSTEDMAFSWCSQLESSRPPDICRFPPVKDARRVLVSDKGNLCCLTLQPRCSQPVHSEHHPPRTTLEGGFSVDWLPLVVSYSWDFQDGSPQELTSLVKRLNLVATYSGRRRNSFSRCKKRTCEALTVICLLALENFLPEYEYHYSLSGNNKF